MFNFRFVGVILLLSVLLACFFICLCCHYLQRVLYLVVLQVFATRAVKPMKIFLNLVVLFLFACVF